MAVHIYEPAELFSDVVKNISLPFMFLYFVLHMSCSQFSSVYRKLTPYDKNYW